MESFCVVLETLSKEDNVMGKLRITSKGDYIQKKYKEFLSFKETVK